MVLPFLRLASLPHQLAVRGRSDAVFSAECAVKVGVIAKAYVGGSLFQRGSGLDEIFGRDEPPLRNKMVKTDIHPFAEQLTDGAFTDVEALRSPLKRNFLGHVMFNIEHDLIQQFALFALRRGKICSCTRKSNTEKLGLRCHGSFPSQFLLPGFLHRGAEILLQTFPLGACCAHQIMI